MQAGQPVRLTNGNVYIQQNDLSISGLGGGLSLTRTWNSLWPATQTAVKTGLFGPSWRSTYEERVFAGNDGSMKYARSDGSFWSFALNVNTSQWQLVAPADGSLTLTPGTSCWTVTAKSGEQRLFDNTSGSLLSIVDRNGNTVQLSYDGANRLTTVADPASRHLNFAYGNNAYPNQVTALTTDFGVSLAYAYDAQGRLLTVTRPDTTTLSFEFDANSFITAVKDVDGKVLESHTYDAQGRGLTSARAGGVEAITVSYPQ